MAQPIITKIQRLDDLRGQAAQGVVQALELMPGHIFRGDE
jgi:hypothetical protein